MEQPLVSVVILSYKNPSLVLRRAIRSVLEQSYPPYQVVLVDANEETSDYSLGLREDMEQYPDIPVLSCPSKPGELAKAKNLGAASTRGKYLTYLLGSDAWNQEYAKAQVDALEKDLDLGLVFCQRWEQEEDALSLDYRTEPSAKNQFQQGEIQDCIHSVSQVMFRRSCFDALGGFDSRIDRQEDYDMWLRMVAKYKLAGLDRNLVCNYLDRSTLKRSRRLVDVVGYLQLYAKHRNHYRTNLQSRLELYRKIAACYRQAGYWGSWAKYKTQIYFLEQRLEYRSRHKQGAKSPEEEES